LTPPSSFADRLEDRVVNERAATLWALGPQNLARVGVHRLLLRAGLHPVQRLSATAPDGPFFREPTEPAPTSAKARDSWRERACYYGWHTPPLVGPPDWLANCFRPGARIPAARPWWTIPDFDPAVGDIKTIWEASRFDWIIAMAQRAAERDNAELDRLNAWLEDWLRVNPPYLGPNWKCGQEASIRLLHLATAALILGQTRVSTLGLSDLVRLHLRRIAPTMASAIGQQNNHGTSEAAALFIGGSWLAQSGDADGARYSRIGRRWLEERARSLIEPDGTFSQYSTNYHRLMLDTYSLAEAWRRRLHLPAFSDELLARLTAAVRWLYDLTDTGTGDAPNLGANDGARLVPLTDTDYRDFRPSVQLAAALLAGARAWPGDGDWNQPLVWLGIEPPATALPDRVSRTLPDGGLHLMRSDRVLAILRYPRFRFRPSQADALHLDLWLDGLNLLRDGGTYSYNVSDADTAYFNGAPAHNLVEVDGRDQMPKISRFLFGAWLRAENVTPVRDEGDAVTARAGYRDHRGAEIDRSVTLKSDGLVCQDVVGGTARTAVLRWRLAPGPWTLSDGVATNGAVRIEIDASISSARLTLTQGEESRYYLRKTALPVLEMQVAAPCTLTTRLTF
jgi:hypothetical protein